MSNKDHKYFQILPLPSSTLPVDSRSFQLAWLRRASSNIVNHNLLEVPRTLAGSSGLYCVLKINFGMKVMMYVYIYSEIW